MGKRAYARWLAWALVAVGLLAALPALAGRYTREAASRRVDLVMEFSSARKLAQQEGYPLGQLLADFRAAGITSVAIIEQNIEELKLAGDAAVMAGADLRGALAASARPQPELEALAAGGQLVDTYTYLLPRDAATAERIFAVLSGRLGPERVTWHRFSGGAGGLAAAGLVQIDAPPKQLEDIGMGWAPRDFALARAAGLKVVPRLRNAPRYTAESVRAALDEVAALAPEADSIMFFGKQVLGWRPDAPEALRATAAWLQERGWTLDMIEHSAQLGFLDQAGIFDLAADLDYRVARVYAPGQNELDRFRPEVMVDKLYRSAIERNIRVLYLRPFLKWQDPGETVVQTNMKYFRLLVDKLGQYGYAPGGPDVFAPLFTPWWQLALMGLAPVGAGVLWLGLTWPFRQWVLAALAVLGGLGAAAVCRVMPNTGPQLLALAAAILFPTLGATLLLVRWRLSARELVAGAAGAAGATGAAGGSGTGGAAGAAGANPGPDAGASAWRDAAAAFVTLFPLALAGGLLVAGLLGDITYMLEMKYFRGVKLELAMPILLVGVSYLLVGRTGRPGQVLRGVLADLWSYLDVTLRYRHVALGLAGAVAVFWYLQRSGNFPVVPVPDWERALRNFLEETLVARPRFKEFAIGYPALALAALAARRGLRAWAPLFLLVGATAGASVVNSFSHLRTPWVISLIRSVHGFWLGALAGAVALAVAAALLRWLWRPAAGTGPRAPGGEAAP